MNADSNEAELDPRALAISVWENEGGSRAPDTPDGQFGRRVEMDRSWTIYHVFTGVPARVDGSALTDLSRSAATNGMLSLNRRNVKRRKQRNTRPTLALKSARRACQSGHWPFPILPEVSMRRGTGYSFSAMTACSKYGSSWRLARSRYRQRRCRSWRCRKRSAFLSSTPCARPFWRSRERRILMDAGITTRSPPPISDRGGRC
jgi:hypothetical protein